MDQYTASYILNYLPTPDRLKARLIDSTWDRYVCNSMSWHYVSLHIDDKYSEPIETRIEGMMAMIKKYMTRVIYLKLKRCGGDEYDLFDFTEDKNVLQIITTLIDLNRATLKVLDTRFNLPTYDYTGIFTTTPYMHDYCTETKDRLADNNYVRIPSHKTTVTGDSDDIKPWHKYYSGDSLESKYDVKILDDLPDNIIGVSICNPTDYKPLKKKEFRFPVYIQAESPYGCKKNGKLSDSFIEFDNDVRYIQMKDGELIDVETQFWRYGKCVGTWVEWPT